MASVMHLYGKGEGSSVLEQFLGMLPEEIWVFAKERHPKTSERAGKLAEARRRAFRALVIGLEHREAAQTTVPQMWKGWTFGNGEPPKRTVTGKAECEAQERPKGDWMFQLTPERVTTQETAQRKLCLMLCWAGWPSIQSEETTGREEVRRSEDWHSEVSSRFLAWCWQS